MMCFCVFKCHHMCITLFLVDSRRIHHIVLMYVGRTMPMRNIFLDQKTTKATFISFFPLPVLHHICVVRGK